ncbi:CMT1A duplicated region transcript 1 protein isoform X2 [Scyliorhinus canicula]|uniref:CMT1A duplicated region transcript 1 protein isoform X2 n=1 Tax=Scyliorhinus canicula TaxID=7830 RepID=UPI0018F68124|nr:CMT1A duplicated region transcript 1 protein isoform X2 [Scyliorhinus canicula]
MYDLDAAGEVAEFNIYGPAHQTCQSSECTLPRCGSCYTCTLNLRLASTKQWFLRAGDLAKQQFLNGLVRRIDSLDLLLQLNRLLQPTLSKDFTHSRSRANPGLRQDFNTLSSNRSLNKLALLRDIAGTWDWFVGSRHWIKTNYLLALCRLCDTTLLHNLGNLIRTLIISQKIPDFDQEKDAAEDASSLHGSQYTFRTAEHPELELLSEIWPEYTIVTADILPASLLFHPKDRAVAANSQPNVESLNTKQLPSWKEIIDSYNENPSIIITSPFEATSGITGHKDFLRCLPIHLAKYILGFLDGGSLTNSMHVSRYWACLGKEVIRDKLALQCIFDEVLKLQGTVRHNANITYAKISRIPVPRVDEKGFTMPTRSSTKKIGLGAAYFGIHTNRIQMEERNVYCGPYNIKVIKQLVDPSRVIDYSGGHLIAVGTSDRRIKFLDSNNSKEISLTLHGHAGRIKSLFLHEEKGFLLSGSYDLSIRRWDLKTGLCLNTYRGHMGIITCLDQHKDMFASAGMDFQAKVWDIEKGKCLCSFRHEKAVQSVALTEMYMVSGCDKGLVHVWSIKPPSLVKVLIGHISPITCLSVDQWHLVSGSKDKCVKAWSMIGKFSECLMTFKHPQEVLCVKFLYLRVISGCGDGKIRIFDVCNGSCLRVMRANGRGDPVLSLHPAGNTMIINTVFNVVNFHFEEITWDYTAKSAIESLALLDKFKMAPLRKQPYSYTRAQRMRRIGSTNEKIYHRHENLAEEGLFHHTRFMSARCLEAARRIQSNSKYRYQSAPHIGLRSELPSKPPSASSRSPVMFREDSLRTDAPSRIFYGKRSESLSIASRFLSASEQISLKRIKRHRPYRPKTPEQIYLTVNAIHNSLRFDETSINTLYNSSLAEDWGRPLCPREDTGEMLPSTAKGMSKVKTGNVADAVKSTDECVDVKTLMAPYISKGQGSKDMLQNFDQCFISKSMMRRSKSTLGFVDPVKFTGKKNRPQSAVEDMAKTKDYVTGGSNKDQNKADVLVNPMAMPMLDTKMKLQPMGDINPLRKNSGFYLLTSTQMKEYADRVVMEHNVQQQIKDQEKHTASRRAWLKKAEGTELGPHSRK